MSVCSIVVWTGITRTPRLLSLCDCVFVSVGVFCVVCVVFMFFFMGIVRGLSCFSVSLSVSLSVVLSLLFLRLKKPNSVAFCPCLCLSVLCALCSLCSLCFCSCLSLSRSFSLRLSSVPWFVAVVGVVLVSLSLVLCLSVFVSLSLSVFVFVFAFVVLSLSVCLFSHAKAGE